MFFLLQIKHKKKTLYDNKIIHIIYDLLHLKLVLKLSNSGSISSVTYTLYSSVSIYEPVSTMEERQRWSNIVLVFLVLYLTLLGDISALSITVTDVECVYKYVMYEGDTVTGNFVVADHEKFWSSDHPGIDLVVRKFSIFYIRFFFC